MEKSDNILNHWSLAAFSRIHGKMKIADLVNNETKEEYTAPVFVQEVEGKEKSTFVQWSKDKETREPKVMAPAEIVKQQYNLQIIEMKQDAETIARKKAAGKQVELYVLCSTGSDNGAWKDVDIKLD